MNVGIPEHLKSEQQAVETQIRAAFRGTRRAGGVSWSESHEVDNYEGQERREAARAKDSEGCWEDLIDDPNWDHETGVGGFNFVDAIGYTYYIAPAMVRCSRRGESEKVPYALTIEGDFKQDLVRLIDGRRARAVARFLRFMITVSEGVPDYRSDERWRQAYEGYWRQFEPEAEC